MLITSILLIFSFQSLAQENSEYEEISIFFQVQNLGGIEVPALIHDKDILLPISEIFDFLRIKTELTQSMDSVSGFFLSPDTKYLVDHINLAITFNGKTFSIKSNDLIKTETNLFLNSNYFGSIFGLDCDFSFRALTVKMTTKLELPVMREMRLELIRQNINKIKGNAKVDSIIPRSRPLFHFGMADWSVLSTQEIGKKFDTRLNLALGTIIAGGEANFLLNYYTNSPFSEKQQYYNWRLVNNERTYLRQTSIGKIGIESTSSIYNPVVGIKLSNTPTTYRKSFGSYALSDYTNPGWTVELYVNNVLVDYKKADASGFFTFQVPLVYGNSNVKLKFYGPWGEERLSEQRVNIPINFLPPKEFEYTFSAGMVEDGKRSVLSRGAMNYGLTKNLTIGSGVEYLSSVTSGSTMPFFTMAFRPLSALMLVGEYNYKVRTKGILSYQLPRSIEFELNYSKYYPGQTAINITFLEERKAIFSMPFKGKNYSFFNRLIYDQIILPGTGYSTAEWLISGAIYGFSTNLTNYAMFVSQGKPYMYSNLSFSFKLPKGILFLPQIQYELSSHELISVKSAFEKFLFKNGYLTLTYENNLKSNSQILQLGFRYDLRSIQTGFNTRISNTSSTIMETARGSLIFDSQNGYIGTNNRASVGKGGIVFSPFLDMNCNKIRDKGEPKIVGLDIRMSGGLVSENERDSTVRITDVEPYTPHLVELDANSFDNIDWRLPYKTFRVTVDPNIFKRIDIPIFVVGEANGTIYRDNAESGEGVGRIVIIFYDSNNNPVAKTLSEPDGFFSYLGLVPGKYIAKIDPVQLNKLHLTSFPEKQAITIRPGANGDTVEGIDFVLKKLENP